MSAIKKAPPRLTAVGERLDAVESPTSERRCGVRSRRASLCVDTIAAAGSTLSTEVCAVHCDFVDVFVLTGLVERNPVSELRMPKVVAPHPKGFGLPHARPSAGSSSGCAAPGSAAGTRRTACGTPSRWGCTSARVTSYSFRQPSGTGPSPRRWCTPGRRPSGCERRWSDERWMRPWGDRTHLRVMVVHSCHTTAQRGADVPRPRPRRDRAGFNSRDRNRRRGRTGSCVLGTDAKQPLAGHPSRQPSRRRQPRGVGGA